MKNIICLAIIPLLVLAGCSSGSGSNNAGAERYIQEQRDFVEPVCVEWENGEVVIENNTLYAVKNGNREKVLDKVTAWSPFSEHSIIAIFEDYSIVEVNTENLNKNTIYKSTERLIVLNTDGTLIFFANANNEVYRYFVPLNQVELLAADEMFISLLCPISTADICWSSYNPLWLKKYYEIGNEENIYNVNPIYYVFCDSRTKKTYSWAPEEAADSYSVQGLAWYNKQK